MGNHTGLSWVGIPFRNFSVNLQKLMNQLRRALFNAIFRVVEY